MEYKKVFLAFVFALAFSQSYSQDPAIEADSVLIKLTVTTQGDEKLETVVNFEDLLTHKIKQFKTGKDGKANCKVSTGANFRISIRESNDSYEYNIPDFAISPVMLTFKFTIK
jgi:hypothetical protein